MKRANGEGSVYQRNDGLWAGAAWVVTPDGARRRKVVTSKNREVVEAKVAEMTSGQRGRIYLTRPEALARARQIGTHTSSEWHAKEREAKECRYCRVPLSYWNTVKDHKTSILRGGSDSIDNLQPICWECNVEKGTSGADEFTYTGPSPRPFRVMPNRAEQYRAVTERSVTHA